MADNRWLWGKALMEYRTLGRTGLKVSVLGLGAGGPSRPGTTRQRKY